MSKLVTDLVLSSSTEQYSEAVALGGHNAAMFEVWLKSANSLTKVDIWLEGSNDKLNWSEAHSGTSTVATGGTAPEYVKLTSTDVIPFAFVRLKFKLTGTSALLDAAVRTFTTSS
jgi:hypothetical protein